MGESTDIVENDSVDNYIKLINSFKVVDYGIEYCWGHWGRGKGQQWQTRPILVKILESIYIGNNKNCVPTLGRDKIRTGFNVLIYNICKISMRI